MKLETIINIYSVKRKDEQPLILKVLGSIKDFGRKMTLRLEYKEIREVYENYEEERQALVKQYINKYCEEGNKAHEGEDGWIELVPGEISFIPPRYASEFNKKIKEMQQSDVDIKQPLKLTLKEIRISDIDVPEMDILEEFIDWTSDPYDDNKKAPVKPKKK